MLFKEKSNLQTDYISIIYKLNNYYYGTHIYDKLQLIPKNNENKMIKMCLSLGQSEKDMIAEESSVDT